MQKREQPIVQQQRDPLLDQVKQQAQQDNLEATGNLLQRKTNDLLLRFGQRAALSGSGGVAPLRLGG